MSHPDWLEALSADLASADPRVRLHALEQLDSIVGGRARELLAEALSSENPQVKSRAEALRARLAHHDGEADGASAAEE